MRGRFLDGPVALQASEYRQEPGVGRIEGRTGAAAERLGAQRHDDVEGAAYLDTEKTRRRDADDVEGVTIQLQAAANRGRAAAELALPKAIANHSGGSRAATAVVVWSQRAAHER